MAARVLAAMCLATCVGASIVAIAYYVSNDDGSIVENVVVFSIPVTIAAIAFAATLRQSYWMVVLQSVLFAFLVAWGIVWIWSIGLLYVVGAFFQMLSALLNSVALGSKRGSEANARLSAES